MTQTLSELIDNAYKIKVALSLSSYQLYQYEDGSYVDFQTTIIHDPALILRLAGGLKVKFLADDSNLIIRMFERYEE
jgi:hypothetical protein